MDLEDRSDEQYPIAPRYHPINRITRRIYDTLASSRLAMGLLVAILLCCLAGVTIYRQERAWEVIFGTLWFNSLLVLLVVNVACCFFGRVWRRRVTVISFGMILFHLSFVAMFCGIIYNSLFYFNGVLRLTEGETLPNSQESSYDKVAKGFFFDYSRLKGETNLIRLHTSHKVDGVEKRGGYEISVGEPGSETRGIIYITNNLTYKGLTFYKDKEGYSPLVVLYDKKGNELYGGYLALQSLKQPDGKYLYTTGTKQAPQHIVFPQYPVKPVFSMQMVYQPDPSKERAGAAAFSVLPYSEHGAEAIDARAAKGGAPIGSKFAAWEYQLSAKEIRYWVAMTVRYEPGKPIVLGSLWIGLAGMIITTMGRMFKDQGSSSDIRGRS